MNKIKLLVLDVDGTLTDGKVYMGENGEIMKAFDIKDGYGIRNILPKNNILAAIITGRKSKILENRCEELRIPIVFQGVDNKLEVLKQLLRERNIKIENVAYCGDDLNDLECMLYVNENGGIAGCPEDAVDEIKNICRFVSRKKGGNGSVRDFIDFLCR